MNQKKLMNEIIIGIVCGLLLVMLFSSVASADHTYDTSMTDGTTTFASTPNPRNLSYIAGTGSTVMVLNIFTNSTTARAGGAPTFNNKTMTQVGTRQQTAGSPSPEGAVEMWYLLLDASDTDSAYNISVPNTNSRAMRIHASTYKSSTGASALDVYAQRPNTGTSEANPSQSITTTVNGDVLVDALFDGGSSVPTANSHSLIYEQDGGSYSANSQYYLQATAGAQSLSWTVSADDFALITAAFKEVDSPPQQYIPPAPSNLASSQDNFWINYTWQAGPPGNITDSFNVSVNDFWTNGTTQMFNKTTVGPHGTSTIIVYAYNNSAGGSLSLTSVTDSKTLPNNPVTITNTSDRTVNEGATVYVDYDRTDADNDIATFSSNRTDLFTDFNTATGQGTWVTGLSDAGTYYVDFGVSDGYGSISNYTMTITVNDVPQAFIPPVPTITDIFQGNFWINYTWLPGSGFITDSYNVSVNDFWTNGTQTFNLSDVGPHGWSNITVYAFNNSGGGSLSSTAAIGNTQVVNNVPVQILSDNFAVTAGNMLTFIVSATDTDNDVLTFSTNATRGTFNQSTGVFSWMPSSADTASPHFWWFRSDDGYGGIATNTTTITVTDVTGIFINGTVRSGGNPVKDVRVSTNTSANTTTDENGFYSLPVTAGAYELTASLEPVYYTSSPVTAVVETGVVVQDIELLIKPTGTITGSVKNA